MKKYTKSQLEEIAYNELNNAYKYNCFNEDGLLNIELFIERYLKLDIEYKILLDSNKLAMLVIQPIKVIAKIIEDNELDIENENLELVLVQGNTVLINENQANNSTEGGLRFSLAHEVAHWILHRKYLKYDIDKHIEFEANYFAAALLMPLEKFKSYIDELMKKNNIGDINVKSKEFLATELSKKFKVSKIAAKIRMECIMENFKKESSQSCVQSSYEETNNTVKAETKKASPVNNNTCLNQQLSYEITKEFFNESIVYENNINRSFIELFEKVSDIAKANNIENWKIDTLISIPKGISQLEPYQFIAFDQENRKFYSLEKLTSGNIIRINSRFKSQIKRFIDYNKEIFDKYQLEIDKLDFYVEDSKEVSLNNVSFNEELIKMVIIKKISSVEFNYIDKSLKFYPCYNVNSGIEVISDIVEDYEINTLVRRYSFVIQPNIVKYRDKNYFEPKIVFRRFVSSLLTEDSLGKQYRSSSNRYIDLNRTIFVKGEDKFITARIAKKKTDNDDNFLKIKPYYKDWFIFEEIKENLDIGISGINSALFAEKANPNILIAYHTSMGNDVDTKIAAGIHSNDKRLIHEHIIKVCQTLKAIEPFNCLTISRSNLSNISSIAVNENKLSLGKVYSKLHFDEINLYIFRATESNFKIEDYIIRFMEHPSEIKKDKYIEEKNVEKLSNNRYKFTLANKSIIFNVIEIINDKIVARKNSESESYEVRKKLIMDEIDDYKENSIAIILMDDLRQNQKIDSKAIIRTALNSIGIPNQFIIDEVSLENRTVEQKDNNFDNKCRAAMLDILNDIGFVNGYTSVQNMVIYSFWCYKIDIKDKESKLIPFIIRSDSEVIEFMILEGPEAYEWKPLINSNKALSIFRSWMNSSGYIEQVSEEEIIEDIIEEINEDKREKIIIASHENNLDNESLKDKYINFTNSTIVITDIADTEVFQYHKEKDNTGITSCIYKLDDNYYRSHGEKVKGMKQKYTMFKMDNLKKEYKHRNLLDIKIIKSKMDNDLLAEIIHRLRLPLTTNIHANMDMLTEHLCSFSKHLKGI